MSAITWKARKMTRKTAEIAAIRGAEQADDTAITRISTLTV